MNAPAAIETSDAKLSTPSRGAARFCVGGPYPVAAVIVLALAMGIDAVTTNGPRNTGYYLALLGLVVSLGTLLGVLWQGMLGTLARLPRVMALSFWPLVTSGAGLVLIHRLDAFSRLNSRYRMLAVIAMTLCIIGATVMGMLLSAMQPTARRAHGWLDDLGRGARIAISLAFAIATVGIGFADRMMYVGLYLPSHLAMRICAFWLGVSALVLCHRELALPRMSSAWAVTAVLAAVMPLTILTDDNPDVLQAFGKRDWSSNLLGLARSLVDFDRDGYASLLGGGDCAPFNGSIHPMAREIPGNGIDDNCLFGDARQRREIAEQLPVPEEPSPLDVVVVTVEALRRDHVGIYNPAYGIHKRAVTPSLDRWARKATVFQNAYASGTWTSIVVPSMFRGLYARRLRWTRYYETNFYSMLRGPLKGKLQPGEHADRVFPFAFDDPHPTLPLLLQRRGMFTAAVLDDGFSQVLQAGTGIEFGFDRFLSIDDRPPTSRNDEGTIDAALSVLRRVKPGKRFFLWIHLFGTHWPPEQHDDTPIFGNSQWDKYDHEILYCDRKLNRLLAALALRKSPNAVFILADHGELIFTDSRHHGFSLQQAEIHIPLLARVPGWPHGAVSPLVGSIDLTPTILSLTNTPIPHGLDGRDIGSMLTSGKNPPRILLSETWRFEADGRPAAELVAAFDGVRKIVLDRMKDFLFSYDQRKSDRSNPQQEPFTNTPLTRAIYGYLEENGGKLDIRD